MGALRCRAAGEHWGEDQQQTGLHERPTHSSSRTLQKAYKTWQHSGRKHPHSQSAVSKYRFLAERNQHLSGTGNVQDEPGPSRRTREQGSDRGT